MNIVHIICHRVVTALESNKAEKNVGEGSGCSVKGGRWGRLAEKQVLKERGAEE